MSSPIDPRTRARKELDAIGAEGEADDRAPSGRRVNLTPASSIRVRPVRWHWKDRLAIGTLSLLGGREGVGKTLAAYTLAASTTRGTLPGINYGVPRSVIVAATEDSWAHTIVPRLMAAGADLDRVFRVEVIDSEGIGTTLSLPRDLSDLERATEQAQAALIILDPPLSRVDTALDTHKDADVRVALEPLVKLAEAADVCVLGIIHVNKNNSTDPLTLLMGSRAFAAVARSVLFVMFDPEDETVRFLGQPKNNLGRSDLPTLTFRIVGEQVAETAEGAVWTGKLQWLGESDRSIAEAVDASSGDRTATREAANWLQEYLTSAGGSIDVQTIVREAKKVGHSRNCLYRAKKLLRITSQTEGFPRKARCSLPVVPPPAGESTDGTSGTTGVPHPVPWTHIYAMPPDVAHTPRAPRSAFDTQASRDARAGCTAPRSRPRRRGRPRGSERFGRGSLAP